MKIKLYVVDAMEDSKVKKLLSFIGKLRLKKNLVENTENEANTKSNSDNGWIKTKNFFHGKCMKTKRWRVGANL